MPYFYLSRGCPSLHRKLWKKRCMRKRLLSVQRGFGGETKPLVHKKTTSQYHPFFTNVLEKKNRRCIGSKYIIRDSNGESNSIDWIRRFSTRTTCSTSTCTGALVKNKSEGGVEVSSNAKCVK